MEHVANDLFHNRILHFDVMFKLSCNLFLIFFGGLLFLFVYLYSLATYKATYKNHDTFLAKRIIQLIDKLRISMSDFLLCITFIMAFMFTIQLCTCFWLWCTFCKIHDRGTYQIKKIRKTLQTSVKMKIRTLNWWTLQQLQMTKQTIKMMKLKLTKPGHWYVVIETMRLNGQSSEDEDKDKELLAS